MIGEAGGELMEDAGDLFDLAEQEGPAVGADVAAIEGGHDLARTDGGKEEPRERAFQVRQLDARWRPVSGAATPAACGCRGRLGGTLWRHRVTFRWSRRCLPHKYLRPGRHPVPNLW